MSDFEGSLPVKTVANGDIIAKLCDALGVNELKIAADGSIFAVVSATDLDIRPLTSADTVTVVATDLDIRNLDSSSDSVTVIATDLDIRNLSAANDTVKIGDGTETIAVNTDGSINVVVTDGAEVIAPFVGTAIAAAASTDFDYTVTSGKNFRGASLLVGGRGQTKVNFGTWDGTTFVSKGVYFQAASFNSSVAIPSLTLLGDGTAKIRVTVTNLDKAASDVYATIQGAEL